MVVNVQPYREEYSTFNVISANLFLWQALVCAFMSRESLSAIVAAEFKDHFFCVFLLWLVPLTYIIGIPLHQLVVKFRQWQLQKASSLTSSLPHRLVHSECLYIYIGLQVVNFLLSLSCFTCRCVFNHT